VIDAPIIMEFNIKKFVKKPPLPNRKRPAESMDLLQ
jgi:hypothetical protein